MVKTTSFFKRMCVAFIGILACMTANAQYTAEVNQDGMYSDYSAVNATFNLTEVATALGTDTATLATALADESQSLFYYYTSDTEKTNSYTANHNGFWIARDGSNSGWGTGGIYYADVYTNEANDNLIIEFGQFPDSIQTGLDVTPKFSIVYGEKEVTFTVHYTVDPVPEVPEPSTILESQLNIVGSAAVKVRQYPRTGYDADAVSVTLSDIAEKLGTTDKVIKSILSQIIYAPRYESTTGVKMDSLTNESTADSPGWWFREVIGENGDSIHEAAATNWGSEDCYYLGSFAYVPDSTSLNVNFGQYPSVLSAGDSIYNNVYIIYGEKAYKITYTLVIDEAPYQGLDEMTYVGNTDVALEQVPTTDYSTISFSLPVDTIAAALNCDASNLSLQATDNNGNLSSSSTANNGGYWLTRDGVITAWGSSADVFVEPDTEGDFSAMHIGQYPSSLEAGDSAVFKLYLVNNENYWTVSINFQIIEPTKTDQPFESVGTRTVLIQQLENDGYVWSDYSTIPLSEISDLIGTEDYVLYAYPDSSLNSLDDYTKNYTMGAETGYNGFWCTKDGYAINWTSADDSPWGNEVGTVDSNVSFGALVFPDNGVAGNSYTGKFFLVNEENNKMVTVNMTYAIVESLVSYTEVGNSSCNMLLSMDDTQATIDLATVAAALGYSTVDSLLLSGMKGMTSAGTYSAVQSTDNGIWFDSDGYYDLYGSFNIKIVKDGDDYKFQAYSNEDIDPDFKTTCKIAFEKDTNRYIYTVTMLGEDAFAGINDIEYDGSTAGKGGIYTISGQRVSRIAKPGLYIVGGTKIIKK